MSLTSTQAPRMEAILAMELRSRPSILSRLNWKEP